jgi:hypothetical protein
VSAHLRPAETLKISLEAEQTSGSLRVSSTPNAFRNPLQRSLARVMLGSALVRKSHSAHRWPWARVVGALQCRPMFGAISSGHTSSNRSAQGHSVTEGGKLPETGVKDRPGPPMTLGKVSLALLRLRARRALPGRALRNCSTPESSFRPGPADRRCPAATARARTSSRSGASLPRRAYLDPVNMSHYNESIGCLADIIS